MGSKHLLLEELEDLFQILDSIWLESDTKLSGYR